MPLDPNHVHAEVPHERTVHLASQGWRYGCHSARTGDDRPRGISGENAPKKPRGCAAFSFLRALFRALSPAYAAYGAPESPSAAIG